MDNHWGNGTVLACIGELVEYVMLVLDNGTTERNVASPEDMECSAGRDVNAHPVGYVIGVPPNGIASLQKHVFGVFERMDISFCMLISPVLLFIPIVVPPGVYINLY